ncbi:hypothetical protein L249_8622 [Ophiocordyceps polyrhachis-furcata BCC 54312]|uniref:Uncharacterized protein n=1 Tax=Ophiocordyceps polyrhachis-furcata BCC 54312 TaxID=1330021 RepID=A0A367L6X2_9HYPO|nr:hypothetical protein L249_8622 [Ophiocordyceps polyrhachis-furcata BCC 54312]
MPVRTRAKAAARGRPQRLPTQFGELETTPTSRHHDELDPVPAPSDVANLVASRDLQDQPTQLLAHGDVFDDELEDEDLAGLEKSQPIIQQMPRCTSIQWSETESLARRSSPLSPEEAPLAEWQFDEDDSLPPLSTPKSDKDQLPDTVPLADASPALDEGGASAAASKKVDFSETASTMRRSSPAGDESVHHASDLLVDSSSVSPSDGKHAVSLPGPTHLPPDNIYDVTPPPDTSQETPEHQPKANAARRREAHPPGQEQHANKQVGREGTKAQSRTANTKRHVKQAGDLGDKEPELPLSSRTNQMASGTAHAEADASQLDQGKKRKQRPKPPLQFDETSRVKEAQSRPSTRDTQKLRMPVVTALIGSAQPSSSSPGAVPRKRGAANNKQPRAKKAKRTSAATQKPKRQGPTKRSVPSKQEPAATEDPALRNRALPSHEAAATTPGPIVVLSDDDGNFPQPPATGTAFDTGDDEPMVPVKVPALSPPVAKEGEFCAFAYSSHYLHNRAADAELSERNEAPRTGSRVERVNNPKLLGSRDGDDEPGRAVSAEKQMTSPVSLRGRPSERPESRYGRQQGRSAKRTGRNYSISVHGSPLPANHAEPCHGSGIVAEPAKSVKDRPPPKFLDPLQLKAIAGDISSWKAEWLQSGRSVDQEACRPRQQRDTPKEPLHGVARDVQAEILASLREHDALQEEQARRRHGTSRPEQGCDKDISPQVDERDGLPDNLSQQLHQVVNTMLQHLRSKEEAGRKVVETYRRNTSGCIEKIRNRQKQERRVLAEAMVVDGDKFGQVIKKARSMVARGSQSRVADMRELEQKTAERQAAYDRAMASLRGLQRQLLQGSEDSGKQGRESDSVMLELKLL